MKYTFIFFKTKLCKSLIALLYMFLFLYLTFYSRVNYNISKEIVLFWINVLIPSLLPFLLFSEILMSTNISNYFVKIFGKPLSKIFNTSKESTICIITGFLCGFPNGAKSVIKLYDDNVIDRYTANRLLTFTNNCNPIYLLSSVGIAIYSDLYAGILFAISHYLSSFIISLIFPCTYIIHENSPKVNNKSEKKYFLGNKFNIKQEFNLGNSILNSFNTLIIMLGFNLTFCILSNIFCITLDIFNISLELKEFLKIIITGIFEMSSGILQISKLSISYIYKMCISSFILSFSSLSVIFQIYTIVQKHNFKLKTIIFSKLIQGILSFIISYILITNFIIFQSPY